jgi:hypothetical protein
LGAITSSGTPEIVENGAWIDYQYDHDDIKEVEHMAGTLY